jgi:hypothetical protein
VNQYRNLCWRVHCRLLPSLYGVVSTTHYPQALQNIICRMQRYFLCEMGNVNQKSTGSNFAHSASDHVFLPTLSEGKTLAKAGDNYQWTNRTTRLVYSYYDRTAHQWKKGTWSKTIRNATRRGASESLMEDRMQKGADKWWTKLFKPRHEFWEGDQIEPVGPSEKWETVASGQWMQKAAWNRMVTRTMREQAHTTPVTTTWTTDFLTREGEDRKAMGDWLHDKLIPWKACRRLLQTNSGTFPCESRLQKWGKHSDGICGLCKRCREMGLGLLGGKPDRGTTGHLQSSVCRLQAPAVTGAHNQCFQEV